MKFKMKVIKTISQHPLTPRWVKVVCLKFVVREIASGFTALFDKADFSKITPEQREKLNGLIQKMSLKDRG